MGFEPTTSTLARLRSTPELRPHAVRRFLEKGSESAPIIRNGQPNASVNLCPDRALEAFDGEV